ncbi:hypothetical protein [uncultured Roseovarius sp.]|uniref:hypothetical protein n=1 Tax=uncultured Roseovarius sp. TaxID=293344 RepID=UPI00261619FA|nr:hypothetical protein [uncultured Roseovarius sp.]
MKRISLFALATICTAGTGAAQQPLSAIEWLDEATTAAITAAPHEPRLEPPSAESVTVPSVTVTALDAPRADAVGLLPGTTTGLPTTLWQNSRTSSLTRTLSELEPEPLPAIQALYYTLLLAEADTPMDAGTDARFLRARLGALRRFGAVEPAHALADRAGATSGSLFDEWFDLSLLLGQESRACETLARNPYLSDNLGARIFCAARAGDWNTAALTYHSATALGTLTEPDTTLLALYLDPEMIEDVPPPAVPEALTPLQFRLFEAIGAPLPTHNLPRAFAMADLRGNSGWKAEIEAAERLARTGAVPASRLFGLYTARRPAASGGVWDRVAAVQALDRALADPGSDDFLPSLKDAWTAARDMHLEVVFAELFAERLLAKDLPDKARDVAFEIALLSGQYERAEELIAAPSTRQNFLISVAQGTPGQENAGSAWEAAIASAFARTPLQMEYQILLDAGRLGEAILAAARRVTLGAGATRPDFTGALATLRAVGLEDTARRASLQLLLLERHG